MNTWTWVIILGIIAFYVWSTYNGFVTMLGRIRAAIQEIGNQLKRQAELIPNLEASAKGYLKHETEIFKRLTEARKSVIRAAESGDLTQAALATEQLAKVLPEIRVVVESNPEIKGAEVVTQLMNELRDTSDKAMYARRTLIDLSADYNIKLATFPSNLIAKMFGFKQETGLKMTDDGVAVATSVSNEDVKAPKVKLD